MVQEIIWSPGALKDFLNIMSYLQENWTNKEIILLNLWNPQQDSKKLTK